jgi:flagellar basal-body rod modification protein FlgD
MNISPVSDQTLTGQVTNSGGLLGKDAFLKMLVTQMRYQDPLNPMNDTEFIAQLAQFSSLEQLQNLNTSFETSMLLSQSLHNSMAVNMIGRSVKVYGSAVNLEQGTPMNLSFDLQGSGQVTVKITDEAGKLVRELNVGSRDAGLATVTWDGKDDNGTQLDSGKYSYQVEAKDVSGQNIPVVPYTIGRVTGIKYQDGVAVLQLGDVQVRLGEVIEVLETK